MSTNRSISRRRFLETAFTATVAATVAPGIVLGMIRPRLRRDGAMLSGIYTIDLSNYPVLQTIKGSVRIKVTGVSAKIIVTRLADDTFVTVSERCPHMGCAVEDLSTNLTFACDCHGSLFSADGTFLSGPARQSLPKYVTTYDGQNRVTVEIPGLASVEEAEAMTASFLEPISSPRGATSLRVRYRVGRAEHVRIALYSTSGIETLRLVDEVRDGGDHEASIDTSAMASGAYLCRMETAGGYTQTRKFVVRK